MVMDFPDEHYDGIGLLRRLAEQSGRPATFTMAPATAGPKAGARDCRRSRQPTPPVVAMTAQVFPRPIGLVQGYNPVDQPVLPVPDL